MIDEKMEQSGLFFHAKDMNSKVIDYLMEEGDDEISIDIFSEKEKSHLLDVKILVKNVFAVLFFLLISFFVIAYHYKGEWGDVMLYSGIIAAAVPVILYFVPFDLFFVFFHKIFFEPFSWTFPADSALIQLYPFQFWEKITFSFFLRGFFAGIILIASGLYKKNSNF